MNNVLPFPDRERARTEACEWLARIDRGLTQQESQALEAWLAAGTSNIEAMTESAKIWDRMECLGRLGDLFPVPRRRKSKRPVVAALAATLVMGLVSLFVGDKELPLPKRSALAVGYLQLYETAIGESSSINLPDGSLLTLNTNSRVMARFGKGRRELVLERGEVFVTVAKDPTRPFEVIAGERVVRALGTAFNVALTPDHRVEVLVTEGKVTVSVHPPAAGRRDRGPPQAFGPGTPLEAGQLAVLAQSGDINVETIAPTEIGVQLSWREGNLVFRGQPLSEALDEIERYTAVEFRIKDDSIRTIRVVGLFKAGDVEGLLDSLQRNFAIEHERLDSETILLRSSTVTQ